MLAQAQLAAGNDQTTGFVRTWLDAWLHRTAKSWAWPVLKARIADLPITVGAVSVDVGNGDFVATYIHRIFNPLFYRNSDYKQRGRIFIRQILDANYDKDESVTLVADRTGAPVTCKIRMKASGRAFTIYPDPTPDKQYYISLDAHTIPANIGSAAANDSQVPWYQSDKTLLQACKCALLEYDDGGEEGPALEKGLMKLAAMVIDDRDFDGQGPGDNTLMGLDPSVFL